jgi:hypothetical protein
VEEIIDDFESWLKNYTPVEIDYYATFDSDTGKVTAVGPSYAFTDEPHKVAIDREMAELILEGKVNVHSCVIDMQSNTLEIAEIKSVFKIDDVLHRIISKEWTDIEKPDIYISYDRSKKSLKFQMTEEFSGTYKLDKQFQPVVQRKIYWDGETVMNFLITDYNDPNILHKMISLKISDLIGAAKTFRSLDLPDTFSVYTRRIFKNYVIEIK